MIRHLRDEDEARVLAIYGEGLASRNATFETELPAWQDWKRHKLEHSRFVYLEGGEVAGFAVLSAVSSRAAYAGVAEVSIYVASSHRRKGIGDRLVRAVIESSEEHGVWTLCASVFPENEASLRLFEKVGFRTVGKREGIARLDGKWRDTLLLERRSPKFA